MTVNDTAEFRLKCKARSWEGQICEFEISMPMMPESLGHVVAYVSNDYQKDTVWVVDIEQRREVVIVHHESFDVPEHLA